ncbi:PEPxxWA-CTERM sorting domain-containing protein [Sphingomonas aerophila]|nr:PEPxxWA-CTERM sorting domain-containing protein [Sphingomonas aerophila]
MSLAALATPATAKPMKHVILGTISPESYDGDNFFGVGPDVFGQKIKVVFTFDSEMKHDYSGGWEYDQYSFINTGSAGTTLSVTVGDNVHFATGNASIQSWISKNGIYWSVGYVQEEDLSIYPSDPRWPGHFEYDGIRHEQNMSLVLVPGKPVFDGHDYDASANVGNLATDFNGQLGSVSFMTCNTHNDENGGGDSCDDQKGGSVAFRVDHFYSAPVMAPVPEPATWASMTAGLGLAGVAVRRRKKRLSRSGSVC